MMLGRCAFKPGYDFQSKVSAVWTSQMSRRRGVAFVVLAEDQWHGEQTLDEQKTLSGAWMHPAVLSNFVEARRQDMLKDAG